MTDGLHRWRNSLDTCTLLSLWLQYSNSMVKPPIKDALYHGHSTKNLCRRDTTHCILTLQKGTPLSKTNSLVLRIFVSYSEVTLHHIYIPTVWSLNKPQLYVLLHEILHILWVKWNLSSVEIVAFLSLSLYSDAGQSHRCRPWSALHEAGEDREGLLWRGLQRVRE